VGGGGGGGGRRGSQASMGEEPDPAAMPLRAPPVENALRRPPRRPLQPARLPPVDAATHPSVVHSRVLASLANCSRWSLSVSGLGGPLSGPMSTAGGRGEGLQHATERGRRGSAEPRVAGANARLGGLGGRARRGAACSGGPSARALCAALAPARPLTALPGARQAALILDALDEVIKGGPSGQAVEGNPERRG
jgi:hypothetical protein